MEAILKNLVAERNEIHSRLNGKHSIELKNTPDVHGLILGELESIGGAIGAYECALLETPINSFSDEALTLMAGNFYALCQCRDFLCQAKNYMF